MPAHRLVQFCKKSTRVQLRTNQIEVYQGVITKIDDKYVALVGDDLIVNNFDLRDVLDIGEIHITDQE